MKAIATLVSLLLSAVCLHAQLLLTEVSPTNFYQVRDEDGYYPDWIELFNSGAIEVNLLGYQLADNDDPEWAFPEHVLLPGDRILIYASGKNRGGLGQNTIDHWETAVYEGEQWRYFLGTQNPPANWTTTTFDDNDWISAPGGFGYGDGDDATEIPDSTISLYYRRSFIVSDFSKLDFALLSMDYDDGFIAYLNGIEIARSTSMPQGTIDFTTLTDTDHEAQLYNGGLPEVYRLSKTKLSELLVVGQNTLAIELHNVEPGSSDLSGRTWLHFGINTADVIYGANPPFFNNLISNNYHTDFKIKFGETIFLLNTNGDVVDTVAIPFLRPGNSIMRLNDTGDWCLTDSITPVDFNGSNCLSGYAVKPAISPSAGFYNEEQTITITGNDIRYTTDGSEPDENATTYVGPFSVTNTSVVRARSFTSGLLPGETSSASYFINESHDLPVLSITANPGDLFNDGSGGLAAYDDYNSGNRAPVHLEYFDATMALAFSENASLRPVGGYSIAFDQKSMQFEFDEEYGARDEVHYPIFQRDKPNITSYKEFRVRNMDDDWSTTRIRDVIANQLALPTHCAATGYQHMAVFINGEYWGHFGGREVTNEYYVRDNHGADEDDVESIFSSYFEDEEYTIEDGNGVDWYAMSDFLIGNDMNDPIHLAAAKNRIDWENWVDYFAMEMYLANGDWFSSMYFNNTRMYRAPDLRWRYILFDLTFAQGNGVSVNTNILEEALSNPYFPNRYTDMMNSLLANPEFKRYFINRFADMMNEYWTPTKIEALIENNAAEIASEISRQSQRWGSADSLSWREDINDLNQFHAVRRIYQRNHIQEYFGLDGQTDITLRVQPEGAGVIHINTIIPSRFPWAGVYFNGNPVTITAVPNPGFSFDHWENNLSIDTLLQSFAFNLTEHTELTAHFTGAAQPPSLELAEINYDTDPTTDAGDWVEIRNTSDEPVDLSHYTMQTKEWYNRYVIPVGTVLQPEERYVIVESEDRFSGMHPAVNNRSQSTYFNLDNDGDEVRLIGRTGESVMDVSFSNESPWPCTPAGYGRTLERYPGINDPNDATSWFDGCMGGSPGVAFSPCDYDLLISEINYNDADDHETGDWFEIKNQRDEAIDLSGWSISDDANDHRYTIPAGVTLPAQGYFVFCENGADFSSLNPNVTNYTGDLGFGLGNGGDVIRLYDASGVLQFSLCFDDVAPWVTEPDGDGYTLELADTYVNVNDGFNWFAGCLHGSPGGPYDPLCGAVGVDPVDAESSFMLFPNPVDDLLSIKTNAEVSATISVIDVLGKVVLQKVFVGSETTFNTVALPAGVYFVVLHTDKTQATSFIKK
jgi:hypothetical protein